MQTNEKHLEIIRLISAELNLPSPPAVAVRILSAVQQNDSALKDIGDIISADPALTAKMLRVANSGYYTRGGQINNIQRAMTVLGTNVIKNIALSFVIAGSFSDQEHCSFDFDLFWRRSVISGVAAEQLAVTLGVNDDDMFVTALLQDIGMLIIALTKGDEYARIVNDAENFDLCLQDEEEQVYGFNHAKVSYALLENWNLPEKIATPALFHHQPVAAPSELGDTVSILNYAARFALLFTSGSMAENTRLLCRELSEKYRLDEATATQLVDDIALAGKTMLASFDLPAEDIKPYSLLLQEANEALVALNLDQTQMVLEMREAKQKAERLSRELKEANTTLRELVYRDGLTGLFNHRYFQEALSQELARCCRYRTSVSLILFDIDHFKKVNDSHGHQAGDQVLMNIARAVSSAVRPTDIIARYGGEEFAVILPETNAAGAKVFAARLRRCVEGIATLVNGQLIYVTVSAGATTFSPDMSKIPKEALIDCADKGLYLSKQNGRNQVTAIDLQSVE